MEASACRMTCNQICLLPLSHKSLVKILFSGWILTCFPTMFLGQSRQVFSNSLPFWRRVLFSLAFLIPPPFLLFLTAVSAIGVGIVFWSTWYIIWGEKYGHNHRIVDTGIFLSFHHLLSSSSFPFGCNSHQVVDLWKWARRSTRGDERKEMLGWDFSLPKDFVMWLLHGFYLKQAVFSWQVPIDKECVNLLRLLLSMHMCLPQFSISFPAFVSVFRYVTKCIPSGWWLMLLSIRVPHGKAGTVWYQVKTFTWLVMTLLSITHSASVSLSC